MKTYNHLYPQIYDLENLLLALEQARLGKRHKVDVAEFIFFTEAGLWRLHRELQAKTYCPGPYRTFRIREPKARLISAAPFRDRVVHHAVCQVIEPLFERSFIFDSYACRIGKGTHAALDRFTQFARRNRYVLKCDVRKFFPSIDHEILKDLLRKRIRDRDALWLLDLIIDHSNPQEPAVFYFPGDDLFSPHQRQRGLPIGNLTSQFFANLYLNPLDHFVKEELRVRDYLRYCDDFVIFSNDKAHLQEIKARIGVFLEPFRLKLHPDKCLTHPTERGVKFLGFKVFPDHRLLLKENIRRFRRRTRWMQAAYARGEMELDHIKASIQAWLAHAEHGDTYRLREMLLGELVFRR